MIQSYTHRCLALTLWLGYLSVLGASAQDKAAKIDAIVQQYVANRQFNGTVLVAEHGKVIVKKGYGMANMEWNIPNTPDTKFRLGSITKQFTSMLIMQLVENGKLKLDGKVTDYLPNYPKATGDKVTIHHLLTHTSGIPSYTGFPKFFENMSRDPYTPDAFVKQFSELPLEFEPGTKYAYDNSGYFLLGVVIEKVTGKPYAQVLQEQILTPLGLQDTGYDLASPIIPKRAAGYEQQGERYVNAPYLDMSIPYAAGSMYSTVEDLYRWDQALYTDKLLSAKGKETMYTPFLNHYAYAWNVGKLKVGQLSDSLLLIEHTGGINGFNTIISRVPKDKQLVVLLNNTGGAPLGSIRRNILNILYDQPVEAPKKSIARELRKVASTASLEQLRTRLTTLKANKDYTLSENEMNGLGYELLGDGHTQEALNVFTLNAELFPASSNVYDSRGEAYMKLGDKPAAIQDYKKSLALDARNTNAIDKLKVLGETVEAPKDAMVSEATLESYVGKYELAPSFAITISREGTKLFAQATNQSKLEIFPESPTRFYLKVVNAKLSFVQNAKGEVDQLILHQNGRDLPGKRVNP